MSPHHLLETVAALAAAAVAFPAVVFAYRHHIDRRDARTAQTSKPRHALIAPWDDQSLLDMWAGLNSEVVDSSWDATPWPHEVADEAGTLDPDLTYTAYTRRNAATLAMLLEATDEQYAISGREQLALPVGSAR